MAKRRPAGDGLVRKRSDGRWEGRIVVGHKEDGSPIFRSVFAHTQKEVMRKLHNQIETYRDVELTEESNMTLGEWLDKWLSDYMALTIRESTMDGYKIMTQHYIKPYLGDEKIGSITTADIQQLYNWLRENGRVNEHYEKGNALSDSMIRSIHMMLHQAMDAAVRERIIVKNPTEGTVIPKNNYPPKQILTEEQEEKKQHTDQSGFQPYQPKHRKRGTGCVYQINDHLWEGKHSPVGADGKRISRNVYAKTKEECEEKLAVMIEIMKREIEQQKQNIQQQSQSEMVTQ